MLLFHYRSPSKSAKKKVFKLVTTKSKEKREKSREKVEKETKDKDKKSKEKEKKDKKLKHTTASEELLDIGGECIIQPLNYAISITYSNNFVEAQPIFGVSLGLAVERSRCHDGINLPLVVRYCIDYLQEHGLHSEQLYKSDAIKTKLQNLKKAINNRDTVNTNDFDVSTACGLLKLFLK